MKTVRVRSIVCFPRAIAWLALPFLAACSMSTISSRSQERPTALNSATPAQKKLISEGWIDPGFTPDMVYIALGNPDKKETNGEVETWIYRNFSAAPQSASLGKAKATVTTQDMQGKGAAPGMIAGQPTSTGGGINASARPDVGSADPVEDVPNLYVYFFKGKTVSVKVKTG